MTVMILFCTLLLSRQFSDQKRLSSEPKMPVYNNKLVTDATLGKKWNVLVMLGRIGSISSQTSTLPKLLKIRSCYTRIL